MRALALCTCFYGCGNGESASKKSCSQPAVSCLRNCLETASSAAPPIQNDVIEQWKRNFYKDPKNLLAQNVCVKNDPFELSISKAYSHKVHHVFTHKIECEGKPITHQKGSSRCWIFAGLNCMRVPFMKQYNLDEFEFSQAHLFYWDKVERCYNFLNNYVELTHRGEKTDDRLMSFLLKNPLDEGGQWSMLINLINKYGVMPKKNFPETYSCELSLRMNMALKSKLREYAKILRDLIADRKSTEEIKSKIDEQMLELYNIIGICLGIPDETFTWEYYDKSKKYQSVGPISSLEFYEKLVKPYYNVDDKLCIVNDPRPTSLYGRMYTVEYLNNVVGGQQVSYNNQPIEILMDLVVKSIKNGEPVWFGCDVGKRSHRKNGILDLKINDFKLVFGVDIQTPLRKEDRLMYGESAMTHAMAFTAVLLDENGDATKFRVENSWGDDPGEKGYIVMSSDWFKEFVYLVAIDKSLLSDDVLKVFEEKPIVLPAWDPMGTLAQ
ncbi:Bleomycin hydrolase [Pseudolycoriella hygida]|uniref:Bleomycin hydrolase n=1 Tax=Pseudolycoriella hygida TaxID=35572 RepID=A0A9Q0MN04_9DIPT|nr:Bleomycin hydrolase [Pseudolycoriella hygida]